jgi:hypothetical protein
MKRWVLLAAVGGCLSAAESPSSTLESRVAAIQWANYYASAYGVPYELVAAIIDSQIPLPRVAGNALQALHVPSVAAPQSLWT